MGHQKHPEASLRLDSLRSLGSATAEQLELGLTTVIDAANTVEPARQMWRDLAARRRERLRWIEVVCSVESVHRARIEARGVDVPGFHTVSWPDVLRRKTETEPWTDERLVLDTAAADDRSLLARAVAHVA